MTLEVSLPIMFLIGYCAASIVVIIVNLKEED
jgi:hypothetical protein